MSQSALNQASPLTGREHVKTRRQARLAQAPKQPRSLFYSPVIVVGSYRLAEAMLLALVGGVIAYLYVPADDFTGAYGLAIGLTVAAASSALQALGLYGIPVFAAAWAHAPRVLLGWTIAVAMLVATVFFLKVGPEFSRVWLATWYAAGAVTLGLSRAVLAHRVAKGIATGRLTRRAVIYGAGPACEELIFSLEADPTTDIRIAGIFDDRGIARAGASVAGYPVLGNLADLVKYGRDEPLDMLIVALPFSAERRLVAILRHLWVLPADVRLAAHASMLKFRPRAYSFVGSVPMLDVFDKPIADWNHVTKWVFDKTIATLALIALSPVMLAVALAIRLDSRGPVLFRQKRYGFNNELIEVFKFRSMYTHLSDANAAKLATRDDPRVTRIGRFIRRTSLDELPQLFNVLRGELSLVGPRPHATQAKAADRLYHDVVDGYYARHKVLPGMTGWAQINGWRGETDTPEKIRGRVACDLYYIEHWSILLDLYILAKTPWALLNGDNAY
jgi:Undecaprenyl-phosphate glucose phosphotransferase